MILPTNKMLLRDKALEIREACMQDSGARAAFYRGNRDYFLYGCDASETSRVNEISPVIEKLASILCAPETVMFWPQLPSTESDTEYARIEAVSDSISDWWHDTGLDLSIWLGVLMSIIDGTHLIFLTQERTTTNGYSFVPYHIYPENFGVYRPSVPDLLLQQAVCMRTLLTMPEIEYRYGNRENWEMIRASLETSSQEALAEGRVFVTNADASNLSASGIAQAWYGGKFAYAARSQVPEYNFYSIYVYDDRLQDYRVIVLAGDELVSSDPLKETGIPGQLPFIKICAKPWPNYFWGLSQVHKLSPVQDWWNTRLAEADELLGRVLDPSIAGVGLGQEQEDKIDAYRHRGGYIAIPNPQGKLEADRPTVPPEIFKFLESIQSFFLDMSGLRPSMFGKQEPGVRTEGMAANLMRFSASEPRIQALQIEKQIEDAANLLWAYVKRYSKEPLIDYNGIEFLPEEFSDKARIRVDGHSSSPIFVEDKAQMAAFLAKANAADPETILDFLHPQMHGLMKQRLKREYAFQRIAKYVHELQIQQKRSGEGMPRTEKK